MPAASPMETATSQVDYVSFPPPEPGNKDGAEDSGCRASTVLKVILAILLSPLILAGGIVAVICLLLFAMCRYNCEIDLLDNLICAGLYWIVIFVNEKSEMESARRGAVCNFKKSIAKKKPDLEYSSFKVSVDYDNTEVEVFRTVPKGANPEELAMLIYFHGGGMKTGHALDSTFMEHVEAYGDQVQMVAIDYGLTLQGHKYPKGIEDCMAVIRELAPKTPHLMLTGVSSGGYLTMATGLRCRDEGISVKHLVPMSANQHCGIDELAGKDMASGSIFGKANAVSAEFLVHCWKELFLKEEDYIAKADKGHDLRTWDYTGLPPCDIMCGSYDFSYAEGLEFKDRMLKAGVDARLHTVRATHAYFDMQLRPALSTVLDDIFLAYPRQKGTNKVSLA